MNTMMPTALLRARAQRDDDEYIRLLGEVRLGEDAVRVVVALCDIALGILEHEHPDAPLAQLLELALLDGELNAAAEEGDDDDDVRD